MVDGGPAAFSNNFGEVLPDRVVFNVRKSLFGGSIREDLPVKHITSVRYETQRWPVWGVVLGLIGLVMFSTDAAIVGIILIGVAILLIAGVPAVTINTAGGDRRVSLGRPFQTGEAEAYAAAVRDSVFRTQS